MKSKYPKTIGVYPCILFKVRINVTEGSGGTFAGWGENCPEISIGLDHNWKEVMDILVHELCEMYLTFRRYRYNPDPDVGNGMDGFLFVFNHSGLSEMARFVAHALCEISEDLHKAYKLRQKETEGSNAWHGKK